MDQESEGTSVVIFVVGGVVLLLLLGGGAAFFFMSWQEDSSRKEAEAASGLKEINKAIHEFKPAEMEWPEVEFGPFFPVEGEKAPTPPRADGASDTLQLPAEPKVKKQQAPPPPKPQK